ncbi:Luciferase-like protein [Lasiodiplodia theobromae]|uniref:Luciferase-like protein n=1 Tax=Lasiodiplodia theobromae TaxID=45133 RepID=UPI0015C3F7F4|nr:Luciferase-like protein [Lasiodiplodia theobromae]KAF4541789.1 Luciferase-like protein [Lasiodiplodia theobromae]
MVSAPETNGYAHTNGHANGAAPKRKMILNAFVEMCSGHQSPGLWRHPDDQSMNFNDIEHWVELAKTLESGGFHAMFIADVLGGYDVYKKSLDEAVRSGAQWPVNEPMQVVPAMAAATKHIGFGVTVSTTYEQPYHLARRLSTLDHLTKGRCGWNVVTGYLDSAARNLGRAAQPDHDDRYAMAEEYMEVMYKLLQSSWRTDAVALDRARGIYTHPERVRPIHHEGKHFSVPGPHICQPSPQRVPVIMQAGTSRAGTAFSSKHAEAVFVSGHSPASCAAGVKSIREQAAKHGRDARAIKVIAKVCIVLGRTQAEAEAKYAEYASYGDVGGALALFGGWTGYDMDEYGDDEELRLVQTNAIRSYMEGLGKHQPKVGKWTKKVLAEHLIVGGLGGTIVGTPERVADELERWVEEADVDGFNIAYAIMPQSFTDVIDLLIPELRRRGTFWDGYPFPPGTTLRETLSGVRGQKLPADDHPASRYLWKPPPPRPESAAKLAFRGLAGLNGVGGGGSVNGSGVNGAVAVNGHGGDHAGLGGGGVKANDGVVPASSRYVPAWLDSGF